VHRLDGMVLDSDNRVYITTVAGVQVFDAKGQYLGSFKAGRRSGGNKGAAILQRFRRQQLL
jgi:sugar lactone lactonase YvrE